MEHKQYNIPFNPDNIVLETIEYDLMILQNGETESIVLAASH